MRVGGALGGGALAALGAAGAGRARRPRRPRALAGRLGLVLAAEQLVVVLGRIVVIIF